MKLLKKIILMLLKMLNTERYELLHPLSEDIKVQVDEALSSLETIQEKRFQNRTKNNIISERSKDSHIIFQCHKRLFRNARRVYNHVEKSRLNLN